ncbi:MAG: tRNA (N6-threonylcarbamoyladenosine(37)-N6)-methyltransferase TrmO [Candidatus Aminicenantes bacterium]|nr:tRNA (N6-threonylcarbamoyladenosine(37)-N6)-methyltransferase TrmO [Candidatus Aminicenantes bacterium]
MSIRPIGVIHSPFQSREDIKKQRQTHEVEDFLGELEIFKEFEPGLKDIDGFSHLIIIFQFHKSKQRNLFAHPPHDGKKRGVFSTRSPDRPNAIGMTIVRFLKRKGNTLKASGIDMLEGTPILDIKPYTQRDIKKKASFGWLSQTKK